MKENGIGNDILIDFDAIVDTDAGMVFFMQKEYSVNTSIVKPFIKADKKTIVNLLQERDTPNPLELFLTDDYIQYADSIFEQFTKYYDKILEMSPAYDTFKFIAELIKQGGSDMRVTVWTHTKLESDFIKSKGLEVNILESYPVISKYDTLILKKVTTLDNFENIRGKNIIMADYKFNSGLGMGKTQLEKSIMYTRYNDFRYISLYNGNNKEYIRG